MKKLLYLTALVVFTQTIQAQMYYAGDEKMGLEVYCYVLNFDNIYVTDGDGNVLKNKIKYKEDEKITLSVRNLTKSVLIHDQSKIGCQVAFFDENMRALVEEEDIMGDVVFDREDPDEELNLYGSFHLNDEMTIGKTYTYYCRFWDKQGQGYLIVTYKFKLVK